MIKHSKNAAIWKDYIAVFFALLLILPWAIVQINMTINSDTAWLYLCAERILSGGNYFNNCIDPNPPLSSLIYMPMVLLSQITGIAPHWSILLLTSILIIFGIYATHRTLKISNINSPPLQLNILIGYAAAITILPGIYFAEREHYIAILAVPYILLSYLITNRKSLPFVLTIMIALLGGIVFLLKPHFGLIPAMMFLHRVWFRKDLSLFKDIDFQLLCIFTVAYIFSLLTIFHDYSYEIFPDVISLYLPYTNMQGVYERLPSISMFAALTLVVAVLMPSPQFVALRFWATGALFTVFIFFLQGKGLSYHLLPLYALSVPVLMAGAYVLLNQYVPIARFFIAPLCIVLCYSYTPLLPYYATHETYDSNILEQTLNQHCKSPCRFYITHENMDIMNQIIFYSDHQSVSRFPSFWFDPAFQGLFTPDKKTMTHIGEYKKKYADFIAEDIINKVPDVLLIQNNDTNTPPPLFVYIRHSKKLELALQQYEKIDRLSIDRAIFYKGTPYDFFYELSWDIYSRKQHNEPKNQK